MKTCMFLCFPVYFKHESTKACMFSCNFSFSAYFSTLPPHSHYVIMLQGLLVSHIHVAGPIHVPAHWSLPLFFPLQDNVTTILLLTPVSIR